MTGLTFGTSNDNQQLGFDKGALWSRSLHPRLYVTRQPNVTWPHQVCFRACHVLKPIVLAAVAPSLRNDDVIEMTWDLHATLLTVASISYTERLLHAWL